MQDGWGIAPPFHIHETVDGGVRIGRTELPPGEGESLGEDSTLSGNASQLNETGETPHDSGVAMTQFELTPTVTAQVETSESRN